MTQRFFVDAVGLYAGSFDGLDEAALAAILPAGAVEVSGPPPVNGRQKWDGQAWIAPADNVEEERIDSFAASPEGRAIVRALAGIKGIDEAALVAELKRNAKG